MKRFMLVIIIILGVSVTAKAEEINKNDGISTEAAHELCLKIEEFSSYVMLCRQEGIPMSTLVGLVLSFKDTKDYQKDFYLKIINTAYAEQRYHSDEYKDRAVEEFKVLVYKSCLETFCK